MTLTQVNLKMDLRSLGEIMTPKEIFILVYMLDLALVW